MATDPQVDQSNEPVRANAAPAGPPSSTVPPTRHRSTANGHYPYRYPTDHSVAQIRAAHGDLPPDQVTSDRVRIAGRLTLIRRQGGLTFAVLRDRTGDLQLFVDTAVVGADVHADFDAVDRGDWIGVEGVVMTTRRGELSVRVGSFALLAKAELPPPDKWRGLTDTETRYRQRYVDLEANARTREIFRIRHAAIRAVRHHLEDQGFTEEQMSVVYDGNPKSILGDRIAWARSYNKLGGALSRVRSGPCTC